MKITWKIWLGIAISFYFSPLLDCAQGIYNVDISYGLGKRFDGIGAISGGGATSKLLVNYPEPYRSHILDFLFKPNFGASLHILKVEIGGDSQSTDGTEASHMHSESDESYNRGYEWWVMAEAKKRNPNIKLYGLPWVFPGWLGGGTHSPYYNCNKLVDYVVRWVLGAKKYHNLDIDYIGIWNERPYNTTYIKELRAGLNKAALDHVQIVVADGEWDILADLLHDPELLKVVDIFGIHYPGAMAPPGVEKLSIPLWSSEDFSATNDAAGGACMARILNENPVNGNFTGIIAWNLVASYYDYLDYSARGLMTANSPWSGHYDVNPPIWTTAHTSQFTSPGWHYLMRDQGMGWLDGNGTYVTLISPDKLDVTIIIETMVPKQVPCFYPMPTYKVSGKQLAKFMLGPALRHIKHFSVWKSTFDFITNTHTLMQNIGTMKVGEDGIFTLALNQNELYTLTTLTCGNKGTHSVPPDLKPFPVPYTENFEGYNLEEEPFNLAQQAGAFEVHPVGRGNSMGLMQMVPQPPIDTCRPDPMPRPAIVVGNNSWADVVVQYDFRLPSQPSSPEQAQGVYIGARMARGGCWLMYADGVFLWLFTSNSSFLLTGNYSRTVVYDKGPVSLQYDTWYQLRLEVESNHARGYLNDVLLTNTVIPKVTSSNGTIVFGTENFATAHFDNFKILSAKPAKVKDFHQKKLFDGKYFKKYHYNAISLPQQFNSRLFNHKLFRRKNARKHDHRRINTILNWTRKHLQGKKYTV